MAVAKEANRDLTFYSEARQLKPTGLLCSTAALNASHAGFNDLSTVLRLAHQCWVE